MRNFSIRRTCLPAGTPLSKNKIGFYITQLVGEDVLELISKLCGLRHSGNPPAGGAVQNQILDKTRMTG